MLHQFLKDHEKEILALVEEKTKKLAGPLTTSEELKKGLPIFYEYLIAFLKDGTDSPDKRMLAGAAGHGKELLRLHYSLSHVVHSYGAMCQAITEYAQRKNASITSQEFNDLNLCLDIAIASAVSEFQFRSIQASEEREVQHMGFLVHELRNALSSATVAHEMIKQGLVGTGGSTAKVLEENLGRMRLLIDRSLSEIRMRADPEVHIEEFQLNHLVDQILLTAQSDARKKNQTLRSEIKLEIHLETDRQLLLSIVANLIQNAIKYTEPNGTVAVRASNSAEYVVIEVEDQCGGLDPDTMKNLFKPFASGGVDQSGLGLGLTIVQRAVLLLQGKITVHNNPKYGCIFQIDIPRKITPLNKAKRSVQGEDAVQPVTLKRSKI